MDYVDKDFGKILKNNAQTLRHEYLSLGTDCFRVYDRNLSRYPVTVDLYGRYAKVTDYGESPMSDEERSACLDICSRMLYLEADNVIYAYRNKRPDRSQHEKSGEEAVRTTVHENGLSFIVDLTTYVDTGLFLDHAVTRQMIRERSEKADVLNLFSYTGSFSVYAASGGAESVTSVDMSATYSKWAEQNLAENGYSGSNYSCVCMDAAKFIDKAMSEGRKYDIIIFDPPSFSNSRKMEHDFDVARDWSLWIKRLFTILKKTGFILFSTNLGTFQMDRRRLRGLSVKEITGSVWAPGFVKGRPGTVRSWIMAFDDDSLTLDWSEPEKKSEKGSDTEHDRERRSPRPAYGKPGYKKPSYDRDRFERRPRYDEERPERRERRYSDEYGERRPRPERPQREYERRERFDRYEREDRPVRPVRPRYEEDRPERRERRYTDERRPSDRPRERRPYEDREERFERRPRYDEDRPQRRERRYPDDRRPSDRPYGERKPRPDRPEREFRERRDSYDRRPSDRPFRPERPERSGSRDVKKTKKPFGYDSFKPARSRDDNPDFFWNAEDLDPKKEN